MSILSPRSRVYRRFVHFCEVPGCRERAPIELHVGTGKNYTAIHVCLKHDTTPKKPDPRISE